MRSYLYTILLATAFAAFVPSTASASASEASLSANAEESKATITVAQSTLTVEGAMGKELEVISLTGKPVMKVRIESQSQRIELNLPKGCYILKIDNVVRKVSIA